MVLLLLLEYLFVDLIRCCFCQIVIFQVVGHNDVFVILSLFEVVGHIMFLSDCYFSRWWDIMMFLSDFFF